MGIFGNEEKNYEEAKKKSDKKDKKNPNAGKENDEKRRKVTGHDGSIKRQDPSVAQDNRGPRMSPGSLRNAIDRAAERTNESLGRVLPQTQQGQGQGRAASA